MYIASLWPAVLSALAVCANAKPTRTAPQLSRRAPTSAKFVTTEDGHFKVEGVPLNFVATNAYWLHTLTREDINKTLSEISKAGIKVVRTWAFNDVMEIPSEGTWFQHIDKNGKVTINEGPNGLQKLDHVVELAEQHGIYLLLSLTNNWSPELDAAHRQSKVARNTLSNDYGGMDVYVRQHGLLNHESFFTNATLINAFKKYTGLVVKRYCKSTAILGWEIANDPRCTSTLPSGQCDPRVLTRWHADIAEHIRDIDTNHLVAAGTGGFMCVDCPKVYPVASAPPPAVSPAPGARRRSVTPPLLTKAAILKRRTARRSKALKETRSNTSGIRIRGLWRATAAVRQDTELGAAYDGSYGVDTADILNYPEIEFGSSQLFPDQYNYGPDDPSLSRFENMKVQGIDWIEEQALLAASVGKPLTIHAFGLVTADNTPAYVPFDSAYGADIPADKVPVGITDQQRDTAYSAWIETAKNAGAAGVGHYQWAQTGLTVSPGTPVTSSDGVTGVTDSVGATGISPNDGYGINGVGREDAIDVLEQAVAKFDAQSALFGRRR